MPTTARPPASIFSRNRTPLLVMAFLGGSGIFVAFRMRAMMRHSEAAKQARDREGNYTVHTGRSGGGI